MQVTDALTYNYMALAAAILNLNLTIETAIDRFSPARFDKPNVRKNAVDLSVAAEMARLKEKLTYKQIGEMYGLNADAVYNRIRRYKGMV